MLENSGDTQARFLAKEPGLFSIQQSAFSNSQGILTAKGAKAAKKVWAQDFRNFLKGDELCWRSNEESSDLAAYNRPPLGLRARLLRDNCIDHRTGDKALDSTLG
jgi:hypothetical protein